jgi:ABC-2 type transport system permease protein
MAAVFLLLIAITFVGFGIALASQFSDSEGFSLIVQFIVFPLFFLSGAIYPISGLPQVVQYIALLNPLTYGVDGLRAALVGISTYSPMVDFVALVVSSLIMVSLGAYLFERVEPV